jgi:hypothetical protein
MGLTEDIKIEHSYTSIASTSISIPFLVLLLASQAFGIASIVIVSVWLGIFSENLSYFQFIYLNDFILGNYRGGFIWSDLTPKLTFNFHPGFRLYKHYFILNLIVY